jgi:hypothetical protein
MRPHLTALVIVATAMAPLVAAPPRVLPEAAPAGERSRELPPTAGCRPLARENEKATSRLERYCAPSGGCVPKRKTHTVRFWSPKFVVPRPFPGVA